MKINTYEKYVELKENWLQLCYTLSIGLVGSVVFLYFQLPLPWMLGSLFATTCAALMGQRIWVPDWLRIIGLLILGALFGTTISPQLLDVFVSWLPSIVAVTAYVLVVIPPTMLYLVKVAKLDGLLGTLAARSIEAITSSAENAAPL